MLVDIYALAPERTRVLVEQFLARFLPYRERADADYTVQLGNDASIEVFGTPEEMIEFCEAHSSANSRAYWLSRTAGDPHSAHVFFLPEGGLVLGLSVAVSNKAAWDRWLEDLLVFTRAVYGYWTGEYPPEATVEEFVAVAKRNTEPDAAQDPTT